MFHTAAERKKLRPDAQTQTNRLVSTGPDGKRGRQRGWEGGLMKTEQGGRVKMWLQRRGDSGGEEKVKKGEKQNEE